MLMRELAISQSAPSSHELLTKGAMRYAEKQGAADIKVSAQFARELVSSGQSPATVLNIPTAVSCNTYLWSQVHIIRIAACNEQVTPDLI